MRRRTFIEGIAVLTAAWPLSAHAQQPSHIRRVGVLSAGATATGRHLVEAFFEGMTALGYQDGINVRYEVRYGEGSIDKFQLYARELVDTKVDLIWTSSTAATTAAQMATASIPIVFALVGDPVYSKLVRDLAHPGGNLTGMSLMISEMWEKRVEILSEIFPTIQRVGVIQNPLGLRGASLY
jgi:putative tryptophan/tyrosine transport system substrate-binding protein